jgi:hypothetical protein
MPCEGWLSSHGPRPSRPRMWRGADVIGRLRLLAGRGSVGAQRRFGNPLRIPEFAGCAAVRLPNSVNRSGRLPRFRLAVDRRQLILHRSTTAVPSFGKRPAEPGREGSHGRSPSCGRQTSAAPGAARRSGRMPTRSPAGRAPARGYRGRNVAAARSRTAADLKRPRRPRRPPVNAGRHRGPSGCAAAVGCGHARRSRCSGTRRGRSAARRRRTGVRS